MSFRAGWNRIFSLSLFVEHMLLGIEELEKKLSPLVLENTGRLGQVRLGSLYKFFFNSTDNYHKAFFTITTVFSSPIINMYCLCSPFKILEKNSDLKTQETFEAVIRLLKICKDGAIERIFR